MRMSAASPRNSLADPRGAAQNAPRRQRAARYALDRDFNIIAWHWRAERLLGWRVAEVLGKPAMLFVTGDDGPAEKAARIDRLRTVGEWSGELGITTKTGEPIRVCIEVAANRTRAGEIAGYRVAIHRRPQTPGKTTVTGVTHAAYQEPETGVRSQPVSTVTENPVGTKLQAARERAGLTKYQLAKRAGVNDGQIRQWERGIHIPTLANVRRLIPHIGGTLDDYFSE